MEMGDYLQKACACSDRWWDTRCGKRHRLGSVVCTMCLLPPTLFMKPYVDRRPFSSVSAAQGWIQLCCSAKHIKSLSSFMQDCVLLHVHYSTCYYNSLSLIISQYWVDHNLFICAHQSQNEKIRIPLFVQHMGKCCLSQQPNDIK